MLFHVRTCGVTYTAAQRARLGTLGFTFRQHEFHGEWYTVNDVDEVLITLDTLEDLLRFIEEWGDVILYKSTDPDTHRLTIYDYYQAS